MVDHPLRARMTRLAWNLLKSIFRFQRSMIKAIPAIIRVALAKRHNDRELRRYFAEAKRKSNVQSTSAPNQNAS